MSSHCLQPSIRFPLSTHATATHNPHPKLGSALCGAAQSMPWLIAARTVQGLGGGAILQIVNIVISDIVALKEYVHLFPSVHNISQPFFDPWWQFADVVFTVVESMEVYLV